MEFAEIYIREITEEDYSDIARLCNQLGYPTDKPEVLPRLRNILKLKNHKVFVAADLKEQRILGWVHVHIYPLLECDLTAEIGGLVVDESCRRKGVGRLLMENAERWARDNNCSFMSLRSNIIRKEAHKFYESIGYKNVKEQYTFRKPL